MRTTPTDLLKLLGSGIRPGAAEKTRGLGAPDIDFAKLLHSAASGAVTSDRAVTLGDDCSCSLTSEQLTRLAPVVDAAEASGATTLLAFLDGKALKIDVLTREVLGAVDPLQGVVPGVDSVAIVPPAETADSLVLYSPDQNSEAAPTLQELARRVRNSDLASLLDPQGRAGERSETGSGN